MPTFSNNAFPVIAFALFTIIFAILYAISRRLDALEKKERDARSSAAQLDLPYGANRAAE